MITANGRAFIVTAGVLVIFGFALGYRELVVLGLTAAACLLVAILWVADRHAVRVERAIPRNRVAQGESATAILTVTNVGDRRSPPMTASDRVAGSRQDVLVPSLAPGADPHEQPYPLPTARRGCFPVGPLELRSSDPLHLVASTQERGGDAVLWVHPRVDRVRSVRTSSSPEEGGRTMVGAPSGGTEFHHVGEGEPDVDRRRINWAKTAQTGVLMVNHMVVTSRPEVVLLLDSAGSYSDEKFEDAVRIVASLTAAAVRDRLPATMWVSGDRRPVRIPERGSTRAAFDRLALASPTAGDALATLPDVVPHGARHAALGVVTGSLDAAGLRVAQVARRRFAATTVFEVSDGDPDELDHRTERDRTRGVKRVFVAGAEHFAVVWKER